MYLNWGIFIEVHRFLEVPYGLRWVSPAFPPPVYRYLKRRKKKMKKAVWVFSSQVLASLVILSLVLMGCSSPGQTGADPSTAQTTSPGLDYGQPAGTNAVPTGTQAVIQQPASPPTSAPTSPPVAPPQATAVPTPANVVPEPTVLPTTPAESLPQAASPTVPALVNPTLPPGVPVTGTLDLLHVDDLLDYQVVDPSGNLIGDVEDLIIDLGTGETGQAPYLVVSSLFNDDFLIPVPWHLVQVRTDMLSVILPLDGNQLLNAPSFNEDFWPASLSVEWKNMINQFWQNPSQASGAARQLPSVAGQPAGYIQADDLLDIDVLDSGGIEVGELNDIAIDWQNSMPENGAQAAQFTFVIVDRGDILGLGSENIPVPWRLIRVNALQDVAQVNLQPQVLQNAPAFDDFTVPDLYKAPWSEELARYWQGIQ